FFLVDRSFELRNQPQPAAISLSWRDHDNNLGAYLSEVEASEVISLLDGGRIIEPFLLELDADAHLDGVRQTHLQLERVALANDGVLVELEATRPAGNL